MVRRAWVSFGVAVFLGAVGCSPQPVESDGPEVDPPPDDVTSIDEQTPPVTDAEPSPVTEEEPPPVIAGQPPPVEEQPPPVVEQEALCPTPDPGTVPAEDLVDARPERLFCELSPDGCDALRASHARRAIPRPCRVWNTTPWSAMTYGLEHDASGRLRTVAGPGDQWDGFFYDACHRLTGRGRSPAWSMRSFDEDWTRAPDGQLVRRRFSEMRLLSEMTVERDGQGRLLGATVTPILMDMPGEPVKHRYTLDAQGRILHAEGTSFDGDGYWAGNVWSEERRYDASGALTEVRRESAGKLLWLKELSQGRLVRNVSRSGQREERWTYGDTGQVLHFEMDTSDASGLKEQLLTEYTYGEDGRLLGIDMTTRQRKDGVWSESQRFSTYRYAEDGRILSREDRSGSAPEAPTNTYQYDYVCEP